MCLFLVFLDLIVGFLEDISSKFAIDCFNTYIVIGSNIVHKGWPYLAASHNFHLHTIMLT